MICRSGSAHGKAYTVGFGPGQKPERGEYDQASAMQIEMQQKVAELTDLYITYKKNLL